jgi:hypothetical protein
LLSGSIYHWSERKGYMVPVTCGICHVKRPVKARTLADRLKPRAGFHSKCALKQLPPQAKTKLKDEELPSGAVVQWSKRKKVGRREEVPVLCLCGAVKAYNRLSITPRTSGCCTKHTAAELVALARAKSQSDIDGNGHAGATKRRLDPEKFVKRLKKFTVEAYVLSKPNIPTRAEVANQFTARGLRPTTGPGVRDNMNRCEIFEEWGVWALGVLREANAL